MTASGIHFAMKLIKRDTDYAIKVLLCMAQKGCCCCVCDLTRELRIPKAFLRRIMQRLSRAKLLRSQKGRGGGFVLAKDPAQIFILDVFKVFQGDLQLIECFLRKNVCPDIKKCPLRKKFSAIERLVIGQLKEVTISSLLSDASVS